MTLLRLARTIAPLRPVQIYGRILFRLRRPKPDLGHAPPRRALSGWVAPIARPPVLNGPETVLLLNVAGEIGSPGHWNDPARDKLWLYNLHYFDELAGPADATRKRWRRDLVDRWIAENPPGHGNGWEPYPVSLRIVNWIKWALGGEPMTPAWLDSLAVQVRWLERRLEWHLLGNHLFANAKALVFAGLYFEGPEADRWLARGLGILARELPEQVLDDGGHFELSPMYHSIILEDLLDLLNLASAAGRAGTAPFPAWRKVAEHMGDWLAVMSHPDGGIAFFNDAAFGIAPEPADIAAYGRRLGLRAARIPGDGVTHLAASGFVRLQRGPAVAILDVGRVGPDYLPGHAHADSLSFELSVDGRRVIVNGGTSTYSSADRALERGTAAHSTVTIANADSSEVWSAFRVGRRARIMELTVEQEEEAIAVTAAHDGYRHLRGGPRHRRTWRLDDHALIVTDEIAGGAHHAEARFHLAPWIEAAPGPPGDLSGELRAPNIRPIAWQGSRPFARQPSRWASRFGCVEPTSLLSAPVSGNEPLVTRFGW